MTSATEPTPIGDEAQKAAAATTNEVQANPGDVETADPVKVDIKRALERETQDGKGDEDPGPSDFQGFATDGVEKEDSQ
jgi:hypothetical protein